MIQSGVQRASKELVRSWGYHLTLDGAQCHPSAIRSIKNIKSFTKNLVKRIDMKAYGPPQIILFGENDKKGYTLIQLIETSNISAHFCEESNNMYFDLFSCKFFNQKTVEEIIQNHFRPMSTKVCFKTRDANIF